MLTKQTTTPSSATYMWVEAWELHHKRKISSRSPDCYCRQHYHMGEQANASSSRQLAINQSYAFRAAQHQPTCSHAAVYLLQVPNVILVMITKWTSLHSDGQLWLSRAALRSLLPCSLPTESPLKLTYKAWQLFEPSWTDCPLDLQKPVQAMRLLFNLRKVLLLISEVTNTVYLWCQQVVCSFEELTTAVSGDLCAKAGEVHDPPWIARLQEQAEHVKAIIRFQFCSHS
ncbi:TPA: hypothetical protein ACH3X2_008994 [Trebouxia sp. C0005]